MLSSDCRFPNSFEDIREHLVVNNDWSLDYAFLRRFQILDGDVQFYFMNTFGPSLKYED